MADLQSRVYRPDPAKCCEACAFGGGKHAHWCPERRVAEMKADGRMLTLLLMGPALLPTPASGPCMACLLGNDNHAEWCNAPQSQG
jgi:hypothetical protein